MKPILFILTILTIIPIANTQNKEKSPSRDNLNKITLHEGSEYKTTTLATPLVVSIKVEKGDISISLKQGELISIEKSKGSKEAELRIIIKDPKTPRKTSKNTEKGGKKEGKNNAQRIPIGTAIIIAILGFFGTIYIYFSLTDSDK